MKEVGTIQLRVTAVIAVILGAFALKFSKPVTMPLAFALFLIALAWPLERWLEERLPRGGAFAITFVVVLLVFAVFTGAIFLTLEQVAEKAPAYSDELERLAADARGWMRSHGIEPPAIPGLDQGQAESGATAGAPDRASDGGGGQNGWLLAMVERTMRFLYHALGFLVLVIAFLALGLYEVSDFRRRFAERLHKGSGSRLWSISHRMAALYQRYLWARTITCLLTGVLTWLFCLVVGLDLALLWGLLGFLLNYIPTLGSIIAVVPPTLFALFQFGLSGRALLVAAGVIGIQLVLGAWVDPKIQGHYVELSPVLVLFAITLWGWVWGIPGAFLGVPLTVGILLACRQFDRTRWLAELLADFKQPEEGAPEPERRPA